MHLVVIQDAFCVPLKPPCFLTPNFTSLMAQTSSCCWICNTTLVIWSFAANLGYPTACTAFRMGLYMGVSFILHIFYGHHNNQNPYPIQLVG